MAGDLYPLIFVPLYRHYMWGGDRIPSLFNRALPQGTYAESWEISDRADAMSRVVKGHLADKSIHELAVAAGPRLLGSAVEGDKFPLLIKIIDAKERLSLQVHPDVQSAGANGGEAKTEMWYDLGSAPESCVYAGLRAGVDESGFLKALSGHRVESVLQSVQLNAGDAVYVPGGRVHAIGEGCLLLEVQQNSDTTYRIYDWGRLDPLGKPRELHLVKAMESIDWNDSGPVKVPSRRMATLEQGEIDEIVACPYFRMERLTFSSALDCSNDGRSFHALFVVSGGIRIDVDGDNETAGPGVSCLMAAAISRYRLTPRNTPAVVLRVSVPAGDSGPAK